MTTMSRREPMRIDVPGWVSRLLEDRHLGDLLPEGTTSLRVEEYDEGGVHVVRVEAPGIDPEKDVDVSLQDGVLTITAERREKAERSSEGVQRSEFRYGRFERSLHLPAGAVDDDVTATYDAGVLEVRVPVRAQAAEARHIPIARGT